MLQITADVPVSDINIGSDGTITAIRDKKHRYREEHSASVVLGVLYDIYRETNNRSTAKQPLLYEIREITQNNGHYNVQGRSRSPILVAIESPYMTS